jgi:hypothetical protein
MNESSYFPRSEEMASLMKEIEKFNSEGGLKKWNDLGEIFEFYAKQIIRGQKARLILEQEMHNEVKAFYRAKHAREQVRSGKERADSRTAEVRRRQEPNTVNNIIWTIVVMSLCMGIWSGLGSITLSLSGDNIITAVGVVGFMCCLIGLLRSGPVSGE